MLLWFGILSLCGSSATAAPSRFVAGRILLRPKVGVPEAEVANRLQMHGASKHHTFLRRHVQVVNVPIGEEESFLAAFRNDPAFEFAELDAFAQAAFVPNDPYVLSGAQWHLARIEALQAWDFSTGATNVIVAVLDSGIDQTHPDLGSSILPGYDFVSNLPDAADDFGHGTAVAGTIIAAGNNSVGVAGVAYRCQLLPVKVVNASGFAAYSTVAQGIEYAVDQGARIINLSIAGDTPSSALQSAIDYAWSNNVVVVAAAGNNGNSLPQYPAACNHVVGVSATEPDDSLALFSSFGAVSLCAPGDNIWTTQKDINAPYGSWRGTSFASPLVAGAAGLVASVNPSLSCAQIVAVLESSADDLGLAGFDSTFGYGRLNVYRALSVAAALPGAQIFEPTNSPATNSSTASPRTNSSPEIVMEPVTILTNGWGRVTPNFNGRLLQIGRTYHLRATPGPGNLFAGWQGITDPVLASSPVVNFIMQSNLTLTARFLPSPYPPFKGNYAGLASGTNGVLPSTAGYFALSLNSLGRFSGRILLAGVRRGFSGHFNPAGEAILPVTRGRDRPLVLGLHVELQGGTDQITGCLSDGPTVSEIRADRNVFNARTNPAVQAGLHPFVLEQTDIPITKAAKGRARVFPGGLTTVQGILSDGHRFVTASTLSRNGDYPLYVSRNRGYETIIGWLNFPADQPSAVGGNAVWVNTGADSFAENLQVNSP